MALRAMSNIEARNNTCYPLNHILFLPKTPIRQLNTNDNSLAQVSYLVKRISYIALKTQR